MKSHQQRPREKRPIKNGVYDLLRPLFNPQKVITGTKYGASHMLGLRFNPEFMFFRPPV